MNTIFNTFNFTTSPLDQFEIRDLVSLDLPVLANIHLSLTNIGLYLVIAFLISLLFTTLATNQNKIVSNN
jgi:F-type H+-transporting ATPase subunit a